MGARWPSRSSPTRSRLPRARCRKPKMAEPRAIKAGGGRERTQGDARRCACATSLRGVWGVLATFPLRTARACARGHGQAHEGEEGTSQATGHVAFLCSFRDLRAGGGRTLACAPAPLAGPQGPSPVVGTKEDTKSEFRGLG